MDINKQRELYAAYASPPPEMVKKITGGKLKGLSNVNPQFRFDALTYNFGLCGIGWYDLITKREFIDSGDKIVISIHIELFIKLDNEWSKPVTGVGSHIYSQKVNKGKSDEYLDVNDEAEKGAYTDAISVACKKLGIAGDVYAGDKYLVYTEDYGGFERSNEKPLTPKEKKEIKEAEQAQLDLVSKAIKEIESVESIEKLKEVWENNKSIQAIKAFKDATNKRKVELTSNK